jgi:monothiol glutaredoxin
MTEMTEDEIRQDIREHIKQAISEQQVMLFMKGTPDMPRCGFSARMVGMLDTLGADYAAMDILPHPLIRQELSELSGWPTIPQLFVRGELVGGCDIATEMFESGELAETLGVPQKQTPGTPDGTLEEPLKAAEPASAAAPRPLQIGE